MHRTHREIAEQHRLAAQGHRTAAEHQEKGYQITADWYAQRALDHSGCAYELAKDAHNSPRRNREATDVRSKQRQIAN